MRNPSLLNALSLSVLMAMGLSLSAFADETAPADTSTNTNTGTSDNASSAPSNTQLKGGVRGAALRTEDGLLKIGQSCREIRLSSMDLMAEVTRKDMVHVSSPNVLPNGVVINAVPSPSGMIAMGNLPARKKRVDAFMRSLGQSLALLQNETDALIIPEDKAALVSDKWTQVRQQLQQIQASYSKLQTLTATDNYDNNKIGKSALSIYDTITKVQKSVKDIHRSIKS